MAQLQGVNTAAQVNPKTANPITSRFGSGADLMVSEMRGRYAQSTMDGARFSVASQAVATTTVGLATTYTGLVIANPIGSGMKMVLDKISLMQSVIQSVQPEAFALALGFNGTSNVTLTTPATPQSNLVGSGINSLAKAATSATLPTAPLYYSFVNDTGTATSDTGGGIFDLEGSVVLLPGAYALWVTPGQASVAGMWFSFQWEEVPLAY